MDHRLLIGLLIIPLFLGCVSSPEPKIVEVVKFQCANGSFSETQDGCAAKTCPVQICPEADCSQCTNGLTTESQPTIQFQCYNGGIVDTLSECPPISEPAQSNLGSCLSIFSHEKHFNQYGWLIVTGEVKNTCAQSVQEQIFFTIYDKQGKILDSAYTYPSPSSVPPGATVAFQQMWTEDYINTQFGSYKVYLEK